MRTEEQIIYTILNTVRGGEFNLDEAITERLLRNYLKTHRASHLAKYYNQGQTLENECYQETKELLFTLSNGLWVSTDIPKFVSFKQNKGIILTKNGYEISVLSNEEFRLNQKSRWNKFQPSIKIQSNKAELYLGKANTIIQLDDDFSLSPLNQTINLINEEAITGTIKVQGVAVHLDPDDSPGYDFTTDSYPFPNERLDALINSVTARDLNIFIRMKSDDIGNKFTNETDQPQTEDL